MHKIRENSGRFVKKKVLYKKMNSKKGVQKYFEDLRKEKVTHSVKVATEKKASVINYPIEGIRFVDFAQLSCNLKCNSCEERLDLQNLQEEKIMGLHSTLLVKCLHCDVITPVETSKMHSVHQKSASKRPKLHSDITTKTVLGNYNHYTYLYCAKFS